VPRRDLVALSPICLATSDAFAATSGVGELFSKGSQVFTEFIQCNGINNAHSVNETSALPEHAFGVNNDRNTFGSRIPGPSNHEADCPSWPASFFAMPLAQTTAAIPGGSFLDLATAFPVSADSGVPVALNPVDASRSGFRSSAGAAKPVPEGGAPTLARDRLFAEPDASHGDLLPSAIPNKGVHQGAHQNALLKRARSEALDLIGRGEAICSVPAVPVCVRVR
jgi:hypothetical protein